MTPAATVFKWKHVEFDEQIALPATAVIHTVEFKQGGGATVIYSIKEFTPAQVVAVSP